MKPPIPPPRSAPIISSAPGKTCIPGNPGSPGNPGIPRFTYPPGPTLPLPLETIVTV